MANNINTKITQKIDRLSNSTLQIGLKGTTISANNNYLEYTVAPNLNAAGDLAIVNKAFVNAKMNEATASALNKIAQGPGISIGSDTTTGNKVISLGNAYTNELATFATSGTSGLAPSYTTISKKYGIFSAATSTGSTSEYFKHSFVGKGGNVITGIKVNEYGQVIDIETSKIKVSELDQNEETKTFDNYDNWILNVNSSKAANVYGQGNTETKSIINLIGTKGIDISSKNTTSGNETTTSITIEANLNTDSYLSYASSTATISHKTQASLSEITAAALQKIAYDKAGHITSVASVQYSDIIALAPSSQTHSANTIFLTTNGSALLNSNVILSQANVGTITNPAAGEGAKNYYLGGYSALTSPTHNDAIYSSSVKIVADSSKQTLVAPYFSGNGASLTNLNAENISSGKLSVARGGTGNDTFTAGTILYFNDNKIQSLTHDTFATSTKYVPITTKDTNSVISTKYENINEIIANSIKSTDAMVFKGSIDVSGTSKDSPLSVYDHLSSGWEKGNTFVITGGPGYISINNTKVRVENGDKLMALNDVKAEDVSGITGEQFVIAQTNIDGAVTSESDLVANSIIVGDGNRNIKNTNVTINSASNKTTLGVSSGTLELAGNASTASNLSFASLPTANSIVIQTASNTTSVSDKITIADNTVNFKSNILPSSTNINIGSSANKFANVYATTFNGSLSGNATSATKVNNALTFTNYISQNDKTDIIYDGSEEKSISIVDLGGIGGIYSSVATPAKAAATALVAVSTSLNLQDDKYDGTWSINFTQTPIVSSVSSKIFNATYNTSTGAVDIAPYVQSSGFENGRFYITSNNSTDLNYRGNFNVSGSLTAGNKNVALHKDIAADTTLAENTILVASSTTGSYDFKASEYSIVTTKTNVDKAKSIPNLSCVEQILSDYQAEVSGANQTVEKTKVAKLKANETSKTIQLTAPSTGNDLVIKNIVVNVTTAEPENSANTLTISADGSIFVDNNHIDLTETGLYTFDIYYASTSAISISVEASPAYKGTCNVYINYAETTEE